MPSAAVITSINIVHTCMYILRMYEVEIGGCGQITKIDRFFRLMSVY